MILQLFLACGHNRPTRCNYEEGEGTKSKYWVGQTVWCDRCWWTEKVLVIKYKKEASEMKQRVVVRYSSHRTKEMVDACAFVLDAGKRNADVAFDLNVFFASQGLGYVAKVERDEEEL